MGDMGMGMDPFMMDPMGDMGMDMGMMNMGMDGMGMGGMDPFGGGTWAWTWDGPICLAAWA